MNQRPLTIGMPISSFLPAVGGMEVGLHNIASRLAALGHRPIVFAPAGNVRALRRQSRHLPYEIAGFPPKLLTLVARAPQLALAVFDTFFVWARRRYRVDVWHGTMGYPIGIALAHYGRGGGLPALVRCAGHDIQVDRSIGYGMRLDPAVDTLVRRWLPQIPILVATTNEVANEYRALGISEQRIKSIPNGVTIARFQMGLGRDEVRRRHKLPNEAFLFLCVGRNHPKKNQAAIVEAAKLLVSRSLKSEWAVAIVGKDVSNLRSLVELNGVSERVHLIEEIGQGGDLELPNQALVNLYRCADTFVFPSLVETFGIAIIEAMAAGLPVITTDSPGCRDIVANGKYGLMVEARDTSSLVGAMEQVLTDSAERRRLSALSVARAQEYDWDHVVNRYLEVYRSLVAGADVCRDERVRVVTG